MLTNVLWFAYLSFLSPQHCPAWPKISEKMGLPGSFPRLKGALPQLGWVISLKVPVLNTLQLSTLCAYKIVQSLRPCVTGILCSFFFPNTSVYRYYSIFLTNHTCHLITTIVLLTLDFAEFVLLPRTSCFLVAYAPQ